MTGASALSLERRGHRDAADRGGARLHRGHTGAAAVHLKVFLRDVCRL